MALVLKKQSNIFALYVFKLMCRLTPYSILCLSLPSRTTFHLRTDVSKYGFIARSEGE